MTMMVVVMMAWRWWWCDYDGDDAPNYSLQFFFFFYIYIFILNSECLIFMDAYCGCCCCCSDEEDAVLCSCVWKKTMTIYCVVCIQCTYLYEVVLCRIYAENHRQHSRCCVSRRHRVISQVPCPARTTCARFNFWIPIIPIRSFVSREFNFLSI